MRFRLINLLHIHCTRKLIGTMPTQKPELAMLYSCFSFGIAKSSTYQHAGKTSIVHSCTAEIRLDSQVRSHFIILKSSAVAHDMHTQVCVPRFSQALHCWASLLPQDITQRLEES